MYNGDYNGDLVFFDTDVTDEARKLIFDIENDVLDYIHDVFTEDKYFNDVPDRYKKLIPNTRCNDIRDDLTNDINDATIKFINSIKSIENAIRDYCDGDGVISLENKATLDFYLGLGRSLFSNDNFNNTMIDDVVGVSVSSNVLDEEDSDELFMLSDDIGTSLYSATSLSEKDNEEKKQIINYNDISMAAIAALTGKIIYDKQQESNVDEDDNSDNNREKTSYIVNNVELVKLNNEKSVNDGANLNTNSVEFKNDILDGVIGDD